MRFFVTAIIAILLECSALDAAVNSPITNAADVISLSAIEASKSFPVYVIGTVTAADPALKGRFFVQDASGGVFVDNANGEQFHPGDIVEIHGITHPGAFAPIITAPTILKKGTGSLPAAKRVGLERLMSGAEDSQRVEVTGLVRDARREDARVVIDLTAGAYRFRAYLPARMKIDISDLIASQVRIRGTAAEAHNRNLRQFIALEIYVPLENDFMVEARETNDPFQQAAVPVTSLAQYRRDSPPSNHRLHIRGVVTLQRLGDGLYLQDETGGLHVQSRQLVECAPGDVVDAVGFPGVENFLPTLEDARIRKFQHPGTLPRPIQTSPQELLNGFNEARFVSMTGTLIERTVRELPRRPGLQRMVRVTLVLQNSESVFPCEVEVPPGESSLTTMPINSVVRANGVCASDFNENALVDGFRLLVPAAKEVQVIASPGWLTPARLLTGSALLFSILVVVATWSLTVKKKNLMLQKLVQEREATQKELQVAHDELEYRVKERTEQLWSQITARKEAQIHFKAVLTERTRLAQELHDTLEQTLTGIALQMDAGMKAPENGGATHHLELARNLVQQGQTEIRRSVWDLRSRALEQFDLPSAIQACGKQAAEGSSLKVTVDIKGMVRPLTEVTEDNILRIVQESLTNIIKHSRATSASIALDYHFNDVQLEVQDDGQGFLIDKCAGPDRGHFGLLGIRERVARLGGKLTITSSPGSGTRISAEIPVTLRHPLDANGQTAPAPSNT